MGRRRVAGGTTVRPEQVPPREPSSYGGGKQAVPGVGRTDGRGGARLGDVRRRVGRDVRAVARARVVVRRRASRRRRGAGAAGARRPGPAGTACSAEGRPRRPFRDGAHAVQDPPRAPRPAGPGHLGGVGVLAAVRPRQRAGRSGGVADRARAPVRGRRGDGVPEPRVRAGRLPRRDRTRRPVGAAPGKRGDGQRALRARLRRARLCGLCRLSRLRRAGPGGAAAAWPRGPRHAPGGDPGSRVDRAGCGRRDRRRGTAVSIAAQRLSRSGAVLRRRRCSARTAAC